MDHPDLAAVLIVRDEARRRITIIDDMISMLPGHVVKAIGNDLVAYFSATWHAKSWRWELLKRVPDQHWEDNV